MTIADLDAIEKVLLTNADICALYESRGVSREDLREVFRLATEKTPEKKKVIVRITGKKFPDQYAAYEIAKTVAQAMECESAHDVKVLNK